MSDYKGLKIPENITIVERQLRDSSSEIVPQGYVVDINNKEMLSNALYWATYTDGHWENGRYVHTKEKPGIEHTYKNGKFKMLIKNAAHESNQGGRLSFWTCTIKCPDGKAFNVGINSDYLCETILHSTIINGCVQEDIWLGKVKGNTMAVIEGQPAYIQAMQDEEKRKEKQSSNYIPGDVVKTLTNREVYLGEWYEYFDIKDDANTSWSFTQRKRNITYDITLYNKPKKRHVFLSLNTLHPENTNVEALGADIYIRNTKSKRVITGRNISNQLIDVTYDSIMRNLKFFSQGKLHGKYYIYSDYTGRANRVESARYHATTSHEIIGAELIDALQEDNVLITVNVFNESGKKLSIYTQEIC